MAALLMSTRADFPLCLAILRKNLRWLEKVPEASGGTSVLTRPGQSYLCGGSFRLECKPIAARCLLLVR